MTAHQVREVLERGHFQPVRVRLTSGDAYEIRSAGLAMVLKSRLFLAAPASDDWTLIPLIHIAAIEAIANGQSRRGARPRRRL